MVFMAQAVESAKMHQAADQDDRKFADDCIKSDRGGGWGSLAKTQSYQVQLDSHPKSRAVGSVHLKTCV